MKRVLFLFAFILIVLSCKETGKASDQLKLESKLKGKWIAKAFDGELHEVWSLNSNGWMQQRGYYIENNDTTYAATTQIQKVDDDIILFSVIRNSNPKIFKSVKFEKNEIIFKNDDYKNPYEVKYEFLSNQNYRRTITGRENDSLVIYEFNFEQSY